MAWVREEQVVSGETLETTALLFLLSSRIQDHIAMSKEIDTITLENK